MKKIYAIALVALLSSAGLNAKSNSSEGRNVNSAGNYTIGLGPVGNFYLTHRHPEMDPGLGAVIYFDYRWSPELSTTVTVMMLSQDGTSSDVGQNSIVFMGIPTFDIHYYFITNPSRWDPYALIGVGYYAVTHGSAGNGVASGLGANVGGGADYYITSKISFGLNAQFHSIALLGNGSTGSFPISLDGRFGFHF